MATRRNARGKKSSEGNQTFRVTKHAAHRMHGRQISRDAIEAALLHGRKVHTRGAIIYALGRKELAFLAQEDETLAQCDGVQVVCSTDGHILTVYRNADFRGLRAGLGRGRRRKNWAS